MRLFAASLGLLIAAAPLAAQQGGNAADPDQLVRPSGAMPAGWQGRTDRGQPTTQVNFVAMGKGYHVTTGPAAVLYDASATKRGDYRVAYTFTQTKAPAHPEAYGLFIGGSALNGDAQAYSYFLVRGTGEYFLATRKGAERTVVQNWTAHPAIKKQDAAGQQTNVLGAEVKGDDVIFTANGVEVARRSRTQVLTEGIAGLRINHNLDVHVEAAE